MLRRAPWGMVLALAVVGCTDDDAAGDLDVTFQMRTSIEAGTEVEHCKFVRAPAEGMLVHGDQVVYSPGSHHFLLYSTPYEEFPTVDEQGDALEFLNDEGVFDCSNGPQLHFQVTNLIGGSQSGDGQAMARFPEGVAMRVPPNAVLLMNAHYINATPDTLEPDVAVTLNNIPESELVEEGGLLFWYNMFIKAPAMSTAHATATCTIPHDVTLMNVQSHMHSRGVDYSATVLGSDAKRDEIYTNTKWEDVDVGVFEDGLALPGGSRIEYTCHYVNNTAEDIYQGPRTSDEMCMLIGSYYPAKPEVDVCSGDPSEPQRTNFMGAEWQGQGSASCNESLTCFQEATNSSEGGPFGVLRRVTDCVIASDPAVAPEFSAAVGCSLGAFQTGKDPLSECASAYIACSTK